MVNETVDFLFQQIQLARMKHDLSIILEDDDQEEFYCASLNLTSSVIKCLALAIEATNHRWIGNCQSKSLLMTVFLLASAFNDDSEIGEAKRKIMTDVQAYTASVSKLIAYMQIAREKRDKKIDVLKWIVEGNEWEATHETCKQSRLFANTGHWIVETPEIEAWVSGKNNLLLCHGEGEQILGGKG